jgi:hypothetical protein
MAKSRPAYDCRPDVEGKILALLRGMSSKAALDVLAKIAADLLNMNPNQRVGR